MSDKHKEIWCNEAVKQLGYKSMVIAMEEMAELQQAVSKGLRGKVNMDNLHEEIADVEIILEWIKYCFNADEQKIKGWKQAKRKRIMDRLYDGKLE